MDIKADSFWVNYIRVNNSSQKIRLNARVIATRVYHAKYKVF